MKTYIYTISDPETGDIRYVGKSNNIKDRFRKHLEYRDNGERKTYLYSWMRSLDKDPIIEIIEECDISEWEFYERYWISQCLAWGFKLTNLTDGGDGLTKFKPSVIKKLKSINKGENNPMFGKKHSKETIDKIVKSRSWYKHSKETINKISESKMGHEVSEETRNKLRIANLEGRIGRHGHSNSEDHNKSISDANSIPIICIETGEVFKSSTEASIITGLSRTQILYRLKKKNKRPVKLNFKYL